MSINPITIIQARMNSKRLPGKILRPLEGRPLLEWVILSARAGEKAWTLTGSSRVVVASSQAPENDPVEKLCNDLGVKCYRGNENDVASRFTELLAQYRADSFIRVSGDSPLLEAGIFSEVVETARNLGEVDIVTTVDSGVPSGCHVEWVRARTFLESFSEFDKDDREHVTRFFYRNPERFKVIRPNFGGAKWSSQKLSVDDERDWKQVSLILKKLLPEPWSLGAAERSQVILSLQQELVS
jgi:spore coat polysaccharide biosynthesis protein SpsF